MPQKCLFCKKPLYDQLEIDLENCFECEEKYPRLEEIPFKPIKFMVTDDIFIAARDTKREIYAIERHPFGMVLNKDLNWEVEPQPSSRTDEFKQRTRFTLQEAAKLAQKLLIEMKK